jgi:glycosyltransferase involved in cell wall biosynthesis
MNITYAVPVKLDVMGGNVQHILGLCRHASKSGIKVRLICLKGSGSIPQENFEIIAFDSKHQGPIERIMRFSKLALQKIKESSETDWVYSRPFPMDYLFFTRHLKKLGIPYAYELNTIWADELRSQGKNFKAILYPFFESESIKGAKALLPVTQEIANHAKKVGGYSIPTFVAGNGIEIPNLPQKSREEIKKDWNLPLDKKLIVMAGFTRPWHGHEKLVAALPLLSEENHVVLVGSESETVTKSTINFAESLSVKNRVHVLPWLNHQDVDEVIYACDIGVAPLALERIKMREAQSLKVRHYLALGTPVLIASGESQDILTSDFAIQLKATSPESMRDSLINLSKKNFNRDQIRQFAESKLSWEAIAHKTFQFIKNLK